MKFFICEHCGNIAMKLSDSGVPLVCCGEPMGEMQAASAGASEKHTPAPRISENKVDVSIGTVPHPMAEEHWIQWVTLETDQGIYIQNLSPGDPPEVTFFLNPGESPHVVSAYCNLHGLWEYKF